MQIRNSKQAHLWKLPLIFCSNQTPLVYDPPLLARDQIEDSVLEWVVRLGYRPFVARMPAMFGSTLIAFGYQHTEINTVKTYEGGQPIQYHVFHFICDDGARFFHESLLRRHDLD